ncbi:MAG: glycerol-3-phosphate acyltransferase, partial [Oscillospiraceae bacterium]
DYRAFLLAGIPALILLAATRYMSLASLSYSALLIVAMGIFHYSEPNSVLIILMTVVYALLAFWRHRENIKRLIKGTESKLGKKKK